MNLSKGGYMGGVGEGKGRRKLCNCILIYKNKKKNLKEEISSGGVEAGHWGITQALPPQLVDAEIQMSCTAPGQHTYWRVGGPLGKYCSQPLCLGAQKGLPSRSLSITLCSCSPDLAGGNGKPQHECCGSRLRNVLNPYILPPQGKESIPGPPTLPCHTARVCSPWCQWQHQGQKTPFPPQLLYTKAESKAVI